MTCPAHLGPFACDRPARHVGAHSARSGTQRVTWDMSGGEGWGELRVVDGEGVG